MDNKQPSKDMDLIEYQLAIPLWGWNPDHVDLTDTDPLPREKVEPIIDTIMAKLAPLKLADAISLLATCLEFRMKLELHRLARLHPRLLDAVVETLFTGLARNTAKLQNTILAEKDIARQASIRQRHNPFHQN